MHHAGCILPLHVLHASGQVAAHWVPQTHQHTPQTSALMEKYNRMGILYSRALALQLLVHPKMCCAVFWLRCCIHYPTPRNADVVPANLSLSGCYSNSVGLSHLSQAVVFCLFGLLVLFLIPQKQMVSSLGISFLFFLRAKPHCLRAP